MGYRFYLGLSPWLIFAVVDRSGGQGVFWAAALAMLTTMAVIVWQGASGPATFLNWSSIALFGGLALGATLAEDGIASLGRFYAAGGLTMVAVASLAKEPIVEPYTQAFVPRADLGSLRLQETNRYMTGVWALAFAGATVSFLVGAALDSPAAATAFNWIVPAVLVLIAVRLATTRWEHDFDPDELMGDADTWGLW